MFSTLAKSTSAITTTVRGYSSSPTSSIFVVYSLLIIVLSLSLLSKAVLAADTIISAVRVGSTLDYTRFTLESNLPIQYSLSMLDNPGRVVIDLENAMLTPALKSLPSKINAADPLIQEVRIGRFKPHILRLVLDLKTQVVPRAFTLEPIENFNHRLVLDIYHANKAAQDDSLGTLIALLDKADHSKNTARTHPKQLNAFKAAKRRKPTPSRIIIVAIDPGHGGKDPGAMGHNGTREKDITLAIAKKLKTRINKEPNMRAVLIRDSDYHIALHERRAKARRLNADLFISVHADAFHKTRARGSSVFTLSQQGATSTAARWLAKKENSVDQGLMGGVDINSKSADLKELLLDLSLNATINDSVKLAEHVLKEIGDINHLHKKHVEQAGFAVLKSPDIPSILVETAFLSNPSEEKKLKTITYQNKMAEALLAGIKRYFATNPALTRAEIAQVR